MNHRTCLCVIAAFLACFYVVAYNEVELGIAHSSRVVLCNAVRYFVGVQWAAFLVPVIAAWSCRTMRDERLAILVGDLSMLFAASWVALVILVWRVQVFAETFGR